MLVSIHGKRFKSLIQLMVAAVAGRDVAYFTFGDEQLCDDVFAMYTMLLRRRKSRLECFTRFFVNMVKVSVLVPICMSTFIALFGGYSDRYKYGDFWLALLIESTCIIYLIIHNISFITECRCKSFNGLSGM